MPAITRYTGRQVASLTTSISTTEEIPVGDFSGGTVHVPTGSSITSLTYWAATELGGTYLALYTSVPTPVAVTQTVSGAKSYDLPAACFGCVGLKIVADAAGDVTLSLKG